VPLEIHQVAAVPLVRRMPEMVLADAEQRSYRGEAGDVAAELVVGFPPELASELAKYGETFRRRTAVLARADHDLDQATFFEDVAQGRGFEVKAFTIFEEAIFWLSSAPQPPEEK